MGDIQRDPKVSLKGEKPTATIVFREFAGLNTQSPRESIADEQFAWLENAMPIGPGNMPLLAAPGTSLGTFSTGGQAPLYTANANFNGNDWLFALMANNTLYAMNVQNGTIVTIGTNFHQGMQLTQWSDLGVLIIDPISGYYDYNITAIGVLTQISGGITGTVGSINVTAGGTGYTSPPTVTLSGGGFTTQATAIASLGAQSGDAVTVVYGSGGNPNPSLPNPSNGYYVGQILTVLGGSYTSPMTLKVTGIGTLTSGKIVLKNSITSAVINTPGSYTTYPSNPVRASPDDINGGYPTFDITISSNSVTRITVVNPGAGYSSAPTVSFSGGGGSGAAATAVLGGSTGGQVGTAIATYAGRAWIANGRNVSYTDVASYNSFGGAGGSFTLSDSTLHKNINALFVSNGYMYIFGDDSIDLLSNVQVSGGATTFSRINLTTSVGAMSPTSIFSYLRAVVFANETGFYALSGSSPTKISDALDGLLPYIDFNKPIYGMPMEINGILCAGFSFYLTDVFNVTYYGDYRPVIAVFFNNKWFIATQGLSSNAANSVPSNGVYTLYLVDSDGNVYPAFTGPTSQLAIIETKLWDFGQPVLDKQGLRLGVAGVYKQSVSLGATVDTEYNTYNVPIISSANNYIQFVNNSGQNIYFTNAVGTPIKWVSSVVGSPAYYFSQASVNAAKGKYLGVTFTMQALATIQAIWLEYVTGARWGGDY